MTTTEAATILRHYNLWRRGNLEGMPQPDPREIGEAIDAAIEMIDRLEAAESDGLEQARLNGMGGEREAALLSKLEAAEKERDALRAKIEQMEKQEPVVWMQSNHLSSFENRLCGSQSAYVHCSDHQLHPDFKPLYALPGAKGEEK